jgi:hypothetical protein
MIITNFDVSGSCEFFFVYMQHTRLIPVFLTENQTIKNMTVKLKANEVVLKAGDTNQVVDEKKIDGKLIVTNQRIYFKSLNAETEKFNLEILFDNIREVIFYGRGLFAAKGLNVVTLDGRSLEFPLKNRDEIGQLINKMY